MLIWANGTKHAHLLQAHFGDFSASFVQLTRSLRLLLQRLFHFGVDLINLTGAIVDLFVDLGLVLSYLTECYFALLILTLEIIQMIVQLLI